MSSKRQRGNKEVKKPKQAPAVAPPAPIEISAPKLAGWQKPHPVKK